MKAVLTTAVVLLAASAIAQTYTIDNPWSGASGDKANLAGFAFKANAGRYPNSVTPGGALTGTFELGAVTLTRFNDAVTPVFGSSSGQLSSKNAPVYIDIYTGYSSGTFSGYIGSSSSSVSWTETRPGQPYTFYFNGIKLQSDTKYFFVFSEDNLEGGIANFRMMVNTSGDNVTPGPGKGYLVNDTVQAISVNAAGTLAAQDWGIAYKVAVPVPFAGPIKPVWEYTLKNLPSPLPILTNYVAWTTDSENGDGLSLMDCIGPMRRYDANRLVLGIRENGIDESGASGAYDTNLASAYPDRSLIWINPTNGVPMGIALNMGLKPVPLDPALPAAGGTEGQYYWSFDVSADGYVYSGYKNQMLRYAPNGSGGISPTPEVVFTLDEATATANGVTSAQWSSFRWAHVRVRGSGVATRILAGGVGPRGVWYLTTDDGTNFIAGAHMNGGYGNAAGNISNFIPDPSANATPGSLAFYGGSYPGNSSGADSGLNKASGYPPFDNVANTFFNDSAFNGQPDPNINKTERYQRRFQGSCDADAALDYVINYSTPPYNSPAVGPHAPGWLALHNRTNGTYLTSYKLPFTDEDEYLSADASMLFMGCFGSLSAYPLGGNTAEVLWTSEVFGYGLYLVNPNYVQLRSIKLDNNIVLEWDSPAILQMSSSPLGPFVNVTDAASPYTYPVAEPKFFRLLLQQ